MTLWNSEPFLNEFPTCTTCGFLKMKRWSCPPGFARTWVTRIHEAWGAWLMPLRRLVAWQQPELVDGFNHWFLVFIWCLFGVTQRPEHFTFFKVYFPVVQLGHTKLSPAFFKWFRSQGDFFSRIKPVGCVWEWFGLSFQCQLRPPWEEYQAEGGLRGGLSANRRGALALRRLVNRKESQRFLNRKVTV